MTGYETLSHNYVHDNKGAGLWADGGNFHTTYEYNKIADNWGAGIKHEISYDATIEHNEISGNGRRHKGWAWDAGIEIQSSGGTKLIEIAYNVVRANNNGITLIDSGNRASEWPTPHGPHIVQNVWVHDNTVTMSAHETTGAVEDDQDADIFTTNHNRFDANTYKVDSIAAPHFSWANVNVDWGSLARLRTRPARASRPAGQLLRDRRRRGLSAGKRPRGLAALGDLDGDVGGLDGGDREHPWLQAEFVRRLAAEQRHQPVRARLDLYLGHHGVANDTGDEAAEPVPRRMSHHRPALYVIGRLGQLLG